MGPVLLLDGNSLLNRAHFGLGVYTRLTAADGTPTAAVYAFMQSLLGWIEKYQPSKMLIAFDEKGDTFRHEIFPEYKGGRPPMDDDLRVQFPLAKELLDALNIKYLAFNPYEADDIIGTFAHNAAAADLDTVIISGDRDLYQLIAPKVTVLRPTTKGGKAVQYEIDVPAFEEHYGFKPDVFIDYRSLVGDSSDGLPGVKGIGKKTAEKLMREYGSLDAIYEAMDKLTPGQQKNLTNDKENAYRTRELSEIVTDIDLPLKLDDIGFKLELTDEAEEFLQKYDMTRILERIAEMTGEEYTPTVEELTENTDDAKAVDGIDALLDKAGEKVLFLEAEETSRLVTEDEHYLDLTRDKLTQEIIDKIRDRDLVFVTHELKPLFRAQKIQAPGLKIFDFKIAAYLIGEGMEEKRTLLELFADYDLEGSGTYTRAAWKLLDKQEEELEEKGLAKLAHEVEFPLAELLSRMEQAGILLDVDALNAYQEKLQKALEEVNNTIYLMAGKEFNINSTQQLSEVLYEDLGLPIGKKTKSGFGSTAASELERLQGKHPIIDEIFEQRELSKLLSGFVKGLHKEISPEDGRIHTTFNQVLTGTGRLSSEEPNLQNIPVRSERGRALRQVFVAPEGKVFVSADYSQIELRLLAAFSEDPDLLEAFREHKDIHNETARRLFPEADAISTRQRSIAKTVNFSIVYGISDYGLSQDLKIPPKAAHEYIEAYHAHYPKVKPWLNAQIEQAREEGFVTTMLGRRRALPEINMKNYNQRQYAERQAMNAPVQGSAADLIKLAMLKVDARIREDELKAKMLLQIHDELLLEVDEKDADKVARALSEEMTHAYELPIPLETSLAIGHDWYTLEEVSPDN